MKKILTILYWMLVVIAVATLLVLPFVAITYTPKPAGIVPAAGGRIGNDRQKPGATNEVGKEAYNAVGERPASIRSKAWQEKMESAIREQFQKLASELERNRSEDGFRTFPLPPQAPETAKKEENLSAAPHQPTKDAEPRSKSEGTPAPKAASGLKGALKEAFRVGPMMPEEPVPSVPRWSDVDAARAPRESELYRRLRELEAKMEANKKEQDERLQALDQKVELLFYWNNIACFGPLVAFVMILLAWLAIRKKETTNA